MVDIITSIDFNILIFIQKYFTNSILDKFFIAISTLGNIGFIWILIGVILLINKKYRTIGIVLLLALLIEVTIVDGIVKNLVQRNRPFLEFTEMKLLIEMPVSYSFPSGHTASSFAAATVLGKYFRKYRYVAYGAAIFMGFSRLYLFVHYPSDVLIGAIIGVMCGIAAIKLMKYRKLKSD